MEANHRLVGRNSASRRSLGRLTAWATAHASAPTVGCSIRLGPAQLLRLPAGVTWTNSFNAQTYLVTRNVEEGLGDKGGPAAENRDLRRARRAVRVVAASLREAGVWSDDRVLLMMSDGAAMLTAVLGCFTPAGARPAATSPPCKRPARELRDLRVHARQAEPCEGTLPLAPEVERLVRGRRRHLCGPTRSANSMRRSCWLPAARHPTGHSGRRRRRRRVGPAACATPAGLPKAAMHRHAIPAVPRPTAAGARPSGQTTWHVLGGEAVLRLRSRQLTGLSACHHRARGQQPNSQRMCANASAPTSNALLPPVDLLRRALLCGDLPEDSFASVGWAAWAKHCRTAAAVQATLQHQHGGSTASAQPSTFSCPTAGAT